MITLSKSQEFEQRTTQFGIGLIHICKQCPRNVLTLNIIEQLLRSGTSIGANYREANGAASKKDFRNKILICKKETKETEYWLQMLGNTIDDKNLIDECRKLWKEAHEFNLIFSKIAANTKC